MRRQILLFVLCVPLFWASLPASDGALAKPRTPEASSKQDRPLTITSKRYRTWIYPKPNTASTFLGYLRVGQSVQLKGKKRVPGQGCARGFYRIEPAGYVCKDRTVTRKSSTRFLRANAHTDAGAGAFPYQFAISDNAPMYSRVPTAEEQRKTEWLYGKVGKRKPLPRFQRGHEQLAIEDAILPRHGMPDFLQGHRGARGRTLTVLRRTIPRGSTLAFTRSFDVDGRTFLLSTDLTVVPADRVRQFRRSSFSGVHLRKDGAAALPIVWTKSLERMTYRQLKDGSLQARPNRMGVRSWLAVEADTVMIDGRAFYRKRGGNVLVAADEVTLVKARSKLPYGIKPGQKWMITSITDGTLVAYDHLTPVFVTLVSPGSGGVPRRGGDPRRDSTTPLGAYQITFKDLAATMSPEKGENRSFWMADVPFTQYFSAPFALHGAYWHENFGEPMSAGCVNASLVDARWLFDWSDPQLPAGWQGAMGANRSLTGRSTGFVVTR